ncbi:enoyl-CoA hydratase/isomerase family protein [Nocardia vulneris]|uniref:enoyl-CoA hydratase/isomerase family protein n=1 Tax=Nocardia vulneris TaxID=1141657 RepID=UPI0030CE9CB0
MSTVSLSIEAEVATITLDNPPQNRLSAEFIDDLGAAVAAVEASAARAVVLRAAGADFSLGGDFVPWIDWSNRARQAFFDRALAVYNHFERLPVPVVAAVQGKCFGGGFELVLRADIVFAGESAQFSHPEQLLGITTLLGGVYRVAARVGRARAMEWALTSQRIPAATLAELGIVNHVVPDADLLDRAQAFAAEVATGPTLAHAAHKRLLRTWADGGIAAADSQVIETSIPLFDTADVAAGLKSAAAALAAGRPRPRLPFQGR